MDALLSIAVPVISVVGSFILVYLNTIKESRILKNQIHREQLEGFYIPFYQLYCRGFMAEMKPSELSLESRSKILDLLSSNIYLMNSGSQAMYFDYYHVFLDLLEAEDGNSEYPLPAIQMQYDSITCQLINTILNEYKVLLRKCYLPVPCIKTM